MAANGMARRCGGCDGREEAAVEAMLQWQKLSDLLIAASLLSIPLELLYFATCAALAPLRRALLQLGTFVVMCGVTHLLRVLAALTAAKVLGALATTAAAASLPVFFPRLLRVKVRESLLRAKARQLGRDVAAVRRREDAVWRVVRAVTRHVRDAVDARAILRTTMLQLAAALGLHNCAVWMPVAGGSTGTLQLIHRLLPDEDDDKVLELDGGGGSTRAISVFHPDVAAVMASKDARVLRPGSMLEVASGGGLPPAGAAAAIRIPNFHGVGSNASDAILVLVRRANNNGDDRSSAAAWTWSNQDLEIVKAVADQVGVALSHAAALEESQLIRHKLAEQHGALLQARNELEAATTARNAAHGAMRTAVGRPMHAVVGLVSVMQQDEATASRLRPEQRLAVDAIARTSAVSSTLMDSVMEALSTMDDTGDQPPQSSPALVARRPFELRSLIRDAATVVGCLAGCRSLGFSHQLEASSLPEWVVGDDRRVFHLLLHMVGALLSRCRLHVGGGALSFSVCGCNNVVGDEQDRAVSLPERAKFSRGNQVLVKFQVGLTRSVEGDPGSLPAATSCPPPYGHAPDYSGGADMRLSTAMCKRIVQMMNGNMWWALEPDGLGETMTLMLRFQLQQPLNPHVPGSGAYRIGAASPRTLPQHHYHHFNGLRILLADSDATSLEVTLKLLDRLGCEVLPVSSAVDCLSLLGSAEPPFQLVVLDLDGHGAGAAAAMDGFEMALRIRELSSACWLLVLIAVAATGVDDGVRDMCRRAGVNGLIQKPITLPALGAQLQRVLQDK